MGFRIRCAKGGAGKAEWIPSGGKAQTVPFEISAGGWQDVTLDIPATGFEDTTAVAKFLTDRDSSKLLCLFVGTRHPHTPWSETMAYDPAAADRLRQAPLDRRTRDADFARR